MPRAETLRVATQMVLLVALAAPSVVPLSSDPPAGPATRAFHDTIEALSPASRVLISLDFGPASALENEPMAEAVLRHALARECRVVVMSLWPTGPPFIDRLVEKALDRENRRYGDDIIDLGFKTGGGGVVQALRSGFTEVMTADTDGADSRHFPIMEGIERLDDFDLIVAIGAGTPGVREWIRYGGDPLNVAVIAGATAVEAPLLFPYYPAQLRGLLSGIRSAAEYEALLASHRGAAPRTQSATRHASSMASAQVAIALMMLLARACAPRSRRPSRNR